MTSEADENGQRRGAFAVERLERANAWLTAYGLLERSELRGDMTPDTVLELARFITD